MNREAALIESFEILRLAGLVSQDTSDRAGEGQLQDGDELRKIGNGHEHAHAVGGLGEPRTQAIWWKSCGRPAGRHCRVSSSMTALELCAR